MEKIRKIRKVIKSKPTIEGAGVRLERVFAEATTFDPFLLLDDFRSTDPLYYIKGFPWHPHRGIETITYVLHGSVEHGDSMENKGVIASGDVQWMTAGSGIIHQEMPKGDEAGQMGGFQLWANLPASHKMMNPRYRDVKSNQIPEISMGSGVTIKVICGEVKGARGPVRDIIIDPEYLDITVSRGAEFIHPTKRGHTVFAYIIGGKAWFSEQKDTLLYNENLVLFHDGEHIVISTENESVRFLLISGKPIGEPVAWRGPIVMNTKQELEIAFEEYSNGTFIKHKKG
ncbi:MAG: pirin family protein [Deltaproteobacteria bacterium]|nr:pirin family protein [Deltaproteobacteria bacterium]